MWDTGRAGGLGVFKGHHGSVKCVCTKPACPDVFASGDPQQLPTPLACLQAVQCCDAFQADCPVVQHVCIDNRRPGYNSLCNRQHSLMGLLDCAHKYVTCFAQALRVCWSVLLCQARLAECICILTSQQLQYCCAICFLWRLDRCLINIMSILKHNLQHRHSSSDAHTEVLHAALPGICTTFSANAAQTSTGLMQGNANAIQGSKLQPLLMQ